MSAFTRRNPHRHAISAIASYAMLALVTVLIGLPVLWLLLTSLKLPTEYLAYPISIFPARPQWGNYAQALTRLPFFRYAANTLFLALAYAIPTVFTSALAGFAFARIVAPGRRTLFAIIVALLIVPQIVTLIPQFVVFSWLKLTNTYWPWILWGFSASPFHIFMFRQFFSAFPRDLEDAAEVDGCSPFRVFWQIFLPNASPVLATSFIFCFGWVWGDWFTPLIYLSDANTTLGVKLATGYADPQGHPLVPTTLAACVLYTLPLLILFFLGQKYIVQGVVTSGLKG
jgi:multiple sugar transport system permease protein